MTGDERVIYGLIRSAGNTGIWSKDLKFRSNLHQANITKLLKSLEARSLVKSVKSVKHPTRRVYMLAGVVPSREVTGGPWFNDSELDGDFVDSLMNVCYRFVLAKCHPETTNTPNTSNTSDSNTSTSQACYSAGSVAHLPSVRQVLSFIVESRITNETELALEDVENLLDALVHDGRLERLAHERRGGT